MLIQFHAVNTAIFKYNCHLFIDNIKIKGTKGGRNLSILEHIIYWHRSTFSLQQSCQN